MTTIRTALLTLVAVAVLALVPSIGVTAEPPAPDAVQVDPMPVESDLFTPEAESKIPECGEGYTTSPGGGAASAWGFGGTCNTSYDDLVAKVTTQANNNCVGIGHEIACNIQVVVTAPCWYSSGYGQYVTDGYANHGCLVPGGPIDRPEM